jgi:tyrocidine synthetase-3
MNELVGYKLSPQQSQVLSYRKYSDHFEKLTLTIPGHVDRDRLFSSIREIVDKHSIFSTTYHETEDLNVQVINDKSLIEFCDFNARRCPLGDLVNGAFADLKAGPLFKVISCVESENSTKVEIEVASVCLDEWSAAELVKQIGAVYSNGFNTTDQSSILQYIQFSEWQSQMTADGDNVLDRLYWRDLNLPKPATLSFDTSADTVLYTDRHMVIEMPKVQEEILRASWHLLIWKLTQDTDTVIENLHPLRDFEELHSSIGPFSKYLPSFVSISPSQTFTEVLEALSAVVAGNEDHKYTYSGDVRYPYGFSFLRFSPSSSLSSDYTLSSPHNLLLSCIESGDSLVVKIKYSSRAFNKNHVQFIAKAFKTIVDQVIEDPEVSINAIRLQDRSRELEFINSINSTKNYGLSNNVFQTFQEQVQMYPDHLAVVTPDTQITYSELAAKVDGVAEQLWSVGVRPGDLVGVLCGQDENIPVAFLASLKLGAAFLPLDPANPDSRIEFIINDSQLKTVITTTQFRSKVEGIENVICVDTISPTDASTRPAYNSNLHDIAYTIYTSGSTGKPKGVQISNGALLNYASWLKDTYSVSCNDSGVLLSSYAFDLGYTVIWGTLLSGACLHILPLESVKTPDILVDYLNSKRITFLKLTPSLFHVVVNAINVTSLRDSELRLVLLGGERINSEDVGTLCKIRDGITFVNHYGPTETTVGTIAKTINTKNLDAYSREPVIGKGISNNSVFIVDAGNRVMSPYVIGEICISGAGVSNGYINRVDLTNEKFVPNPYLPGQVMYKTGDLGYWTLNGDVVLKGRIDDQVKVRGYRVELDEINSVFSRYRSVSQAVVLARPSREGSNELYSYVVAADDFISEDFKNYLKESLPEYMIPAQIMMVDAIPLNKNGKIDRQALANIEAKDLATPTEYLAPRTPLEKSLVALFEEVLKKTRVGITDDFFDLGGNSLKAIQLVSRIYKTLNHKVDLKMIFTETTVQKLAEVISPSATGGYSEIRALEKRSSYPVSSGQRRLWILSQQDTLSNIYNVPSCYRIKGNLDVAALTKAFDSVVARHESLRTTFSMVDGTVAQIINSFEQTGFAVKYVDLSRAIGKDNEIKELAEQHALETFNLANGPLIRVMLIRESTDSHVLCMNVHHIISDEWSRSVLISDVLSLYKTNKINAPGELSPLRIHYKDFATWQSEELGGDRVTAHREYWLNQLSGELPVLNLPTDFARPAVKSNRGDNIRAGIDSELGQQLSRVSQEKGVSLFMIFASALKVLFYKYTGQRDMIIGMPVTGRKHSELEDQIGFYVNTLAIRSKINDGDCFADFLLREKETTLHAYAHDVYPFDRLLEDLKPERDLSRSPLFDVLTLFRSASLFSGDNYTIDGLEFDNYDLDIPHSKFDLTFNFNEDTDGLNLSVEFCSDLYTRSTVQRMVNHYLQLLQGLVTNMECKLEQVQYISNDERNELVNLLNATEQEFPSTKTIADLFEEQCESTPDAIALVSGTNRITYAEVNRRANRLASYLMMTLNVHADDLVGIMMDRSVEQVVGLLGILKAGAAYVPIDKKNPESAVDRILQGGTVKAVLLDSDMDKTFFVTRGYLYVIKEHYGVASNNQYDNPVRTSNASSLACIIHTSGSTGVPKGVMIENRGVAKLVKNTNYYNFKVGGKLLQTASLAFDASTFELWGPLLNGGEVHLIGTEQLLNERFLKEYISEQKIDVMFFTTSLLNQLIDSDVSIFNNSLTILTGGERVSKPHIQKLKSAYPGLTVINLYGPAENTTLSTFYKIDDIGTNDIPIGKPVSNSTVYILDEHNNLAGKGIYGEICVGGDGLARGYFRDEALTDQKFVPHPFEAGKRIYKTGDIGRWTDDGNIEYHGRKDRQLKLRGYRIEISEIENALRSHPAIMNAVVLMRQRGETGKQLVAYILANTGVTAGELRRYLKDHLVEYMIPGSFVFLDKLPLTASGKIDERALPEPGFSETTEEDVSPRNNLERAVTTVWEQVLERQNISIDANFFDLGGHSLKASQLITKLYKELNCKIELRDVFTNPTVRELSHVIENSGQISFKAIEQVGSADNYPLSHAQKRLWIVDQLQSERDAYNINNAYNLRGRFDVAALNNSLTALVKRHEILRTSFVMIDGEVRQRVHEINEFAVQYDDLRGDARKLSMIEKILVEEESKTFDLGKYPLMRARLIHVADEEYVFILTLHHIVSDGWSMDILFDELTEMYNGFSNNVDPSMPPLQVQYKDYAKWHNDLLNESQSKKYRSYWMEKFTDPAPALNLPTDYHRPKLKTFSGDNVLVQVDKEISDALSRISKESNYSLFIVLLAAVKAVFFKYTGQDDITVGTAVAGRDHIDLENQIGYYVNNLPLRTKFSGDDTLRELIARVAETTLGAFEHQLYPFDLLVDDLAIPIDGGQRSPLFDVVVTSQNFGGGQGGIKDLAIVKRTKRTSKCKYDMVVTFVDNSGGIVANIEYNTDLFSEATIGQLGNNLLSVLRCMVYSANDTLNDLQVRIGTADVNRKSFKESFDFDFNL